MSEGGVKQWLADQLSTIPGVVVHKDLYKWGEASDQITFLAFPSVEIPLSFGDTGALYETTYMPELLVMLLDPSAEDAQTVLRGYLRQINRILRSAPSFVPLTDPDTGEQSVLAMVGPEIQARRATVQDVGPGMGEEGEAFTSVIVVPKLVEHRVGS